METKRQVRAAAGLLEGAGVGGWVGVGAWGRVVGEGVEGLAPGAGCMVWG